MGHMDTEAGRVFAKAARRLIPFMALLYVVSFLDRVNVGFAALTMNKDLGFSPAVYGFGAGIFFVGYLLFQVPSSVVLARVGTRRAIFCILAAWGAISAGTALAENLDTAHKLLTRADERMYRRKSRLRAPAFATAANFGHL